MKISELSKEKQKWLKENHAIKTTGYDFVIPDTKHLFSIEYLKNHTLEEIKENYKNLYS
jgi:hypothetical protein